MKKNRFDTQEEPLANNKTFSVIADFDGNEEKLFEQEVDKVLAILPLRNMVLFPGVVMPVSIGRGSSLQLLNEARLRNKLIGAVCQRNPDKEHPRLYDLYPTGVVAKVVRLFEMPDNSITAILQGMQRFRLLDLVDNDKSYLTAEISVLKEILPEKNDKEYQVLVDTAKDLALQFLQVDNQQNESAFAVQNITNQMFLINFICTNFPFNTFDQIRMLEENSLIQRAYRLVGILRQTLQLAQLKADITMRTREDINQQQREYFLQQQIKNIQDELGGSPAEKDIDQLTELADKKKWSKEVRAVFDKELTRLERTNPNTPDYNVQLTYLQTLLNLPWNQYTKDNLKMDNAEKVLNKDHYGLEKVKERILEHLAVLKLRGDQKSPILCLYGPPGVGKTSLGKSIAAALKRKYVRMSLGGLHDESEIRGHRRTYIGAMPGRIIKGLAKAGSSNPVFILDEIDKVTQNTVNGDPSSALLEVLDPEQNKAFHDNYIDVDYDLSKVMFIATANNLNTIPTPLLDRMELIEVSGYITEEKVEIARKHLVPKVMKEVGLDREKIKISKPALEIMVESYTRESGVRQLEKKIEKVYRKIARYYAEHLYFPVDKEVKPDDLKELLGAPEYTRDKYQGNEYAGVVTGLAWTAVGGEILFVETSLSKGKGGKLTLTGNLGDVMKESAMLALEYIKAHASLLGLNPEVFENWNIHVHVPEGAIPKDGPSAGITMATSLASALTQRKVKANLAMTGEITLRGKVLPVGGIKEKILAAKRAGIKDIIMCAENRKDIEEIPEMYLKGLTFHYVNDVKEVFTLALTDEKVADAIDVNA